MRVTAMVAVLLAAVAASPVQAAGEDPVALVRELMRMQQTMIATNGADGEGPWSPTSLDYFYTPELKAAYLAVMERSQARNEPLLNGDPIVGRQEYCTLRNLEVEMQAGAGNQVGVTAAFQSQWCFPEAGPAIAGAETVVAFVLTYDRGRWRIDDFVQEGQGSFRELLASLMRE